jgi:hypothetical protein
VCHRKGNENVTPPGKVNQAVDHLVSWRRD